MKKDWLEPVSNHVKVEVRGKQIETFMNACLEKKLAIWEVRRTSPETVSLCFYTKDLKKISAVLKKTGCKLRFLEKMGWAFWLLRLWRRNGIVLGILAFFVAVVLLSNMVWNINVTGANPKTEYELIKAAKKIGVTKGKFIFLLPNVREIQRRLTNEMDNVTWIGVGLHGTTFTFQVVEKDIPKREKTASPRHLVAKKDAVIHDMFVEKGQPVVSINQYVSKGSLLVSGYIGNEQHAELVPAKGVVMGETWYTSKVSVPLVTHFNTYTGRSSSRHFLNLFGVSIPVWGFSEGDYKHKEESEDETPLKFWKWTMPLSYEKKQYRETDGVKREYTKEEAILAGKKMAYKDVAKRLPPGSKIIDEKILRMTVSNGKVNLSMHYQVIENIASEQPIPIQQGD
ncbi:stage IV sporulation protein [Fictibacillus macauensis ZFHKF-1]|uniref:Stage IV sporulation protein n=1 Tax=Fictibacillus macauensis ZFHKF-1 TaxID=1196324 RepID=I8J0E6_9BACL|nr:sporulation protein YqfD [Fictibacillus macauensis]EIT85216.1 stage IV sporulation protein [Fictibacillus macauensis ZFHKF-1]